MPRGGKVVEISNFDAAGFVQPVAQLFGQYLRRGLQRDAGSAQPLIGSSFHQGDLGHQGCLDAAWFAADGHELHPSALRGRTGFCHERPLDLPAKTALRPFEDDAVAKQVHIGGLAMPPSRLQHGSAAHGHVAFINELAQHRGGGLSGGQLLGGNHCAKAKRSAAG